MTDKIEIFIDAAKQPPAPMPDLPTQHEAAE
jgi:hypothetical protein